MPRRIRVEVDERTETMTDEALLCRDLRHAWAPVSQGASRRRELLRLGQTERVLRCTRGCGTTKSQIFELPRFNVLKTKMDYADGYLLTVRGTGRISSDDARAALFVRSDEVLV